MQYFEGVIAGSILPAPAKGLQAVPSNQAQRYIPTDNMLAARALSKATPARAAVSRAAGSAAPKRGMAAGGPPPKYTGIEAQVRARLPKDEQVRSGICIARCNIVILGISVLFLPLNISTCCVYLKFP